MPADTPALSDPTAPRKVVAQRIAVIINPVAGLKSEAEQIIRAYLSDFQDREITIRLTEGAQDATRFAREAAEAGAQLVVAYGGDGTMTEVASGLRDTGVPMGMLPGGTANVMAIELGVPVALDQALDLIFRQPHRLRKVDMGSIDSQPFLLRAGIGYEAEFSATAPRAAKRERGRLAYFEHALNRFRKLRPARYIIHAGGETHVVRGVTCMICNSTNIGVGKLQLLYESSVSDGLLDVVVIEGFGVGSLLRIAGSIIQSVLPGRKTAPSPIRHWQVSAVKIEIRPRQLVAFDGEKLKRARQVSAHVIPDAVEIVVPLDLNAAADNVTPAETTMDGTTRTEVT